MRCIAGRLCGMGEFRPRTRQPLACPRAFHLKIRNAQSIANGGANQVRCLVVIVIGHPSAPQRCGRIRQQPGHFKFGGRCKPGLFADVSGCVIDPQFRNQRDSKASVFKCCKNGPRHGSVTRWNRVLWGFKRSVESNCHTPGRPPMIARKRLAR